MEGRSESMDGHAAARSVRGDRNWGRSPREQ